MTVKPLAGARSPLGGATFGNKDSFRAEEVPFTPGYDLRVEPGTPAFKAVCEALALELPTTVGTVTRNGAICLGQPGYDKNETAGVIALALGPDWWLLTGTADPEALLADVRAQHHMSLVDVSAQRTKLEVYGPQSRAVLEHIWEQDLRDESFPVDSCSQGIMAKAPVIVWHCCTDCYCVMVRASFARHLWSALTDAAVEYV